jgi:hypothetical protein
VGPLYESTWCKNRLAPRPMSLESYSTTQWEGTEHRSFARNVALDRPAIGHFANWAGGWSGSFTYAAVTGGVGLLRSGVHGREGPRQQPRHAHVEEVRVFLTERRRVFQNRSGQFQT